ncbi:MAG: carbohydrate ABC transporter permease [Sphaerochaetaceae bacterium]
MSEKHETHFWFYLIGTAISIIALVPFLWMISTSFKSNGALLALPIEWIPKKPTFESYSKLFQLSGFLSSSFNSLFVAVLSVSVGLLSASAAAFAFAKLRFKGKDLLFMVFIASLMIPSQVSFIPLYLIMNNLRLTNKLIALVVPCVFKAFAVFMLRQQIMSIPDAYMDAASLDGASLGKTFFRIILPMCRTSLVTLAIILFMDSWNDYLLPLVLMTSKEHFTLPILLNSLSGEFKTSFNLLMAGSLLSMIPILIVYVCSRKYFSNGLQVGGIKG